MATVWILPTLQVFTGGKDKVMAHGTTVRHIIDSLDQQYPGIKKVLLNEEANRVNPGVAVVVDGETSSLGLLEQVRENSEIHFIHAISGGSA